MEILIDGYNLLNAMPMLRSLPRSGDEQREYLIKILSTYRRLKGHQITLCFDAYQDPCQSDLIEKSLGIKIIYTGQGKTCDDYIKQFVEKASKEKRLSPEKIMVVTSDREIIDYVQRFSVESISSSEFKDRLEMSMIGDIKGEEDPDDFEPQKKTTKKKGPSKRLSKKERKKKNLREKL